MQWVGEVRAENVQASESANGFCVFLVGCKADHYKVVDRHEAELVAKKLGAEYFEVSAKTGMAVRPVVRTPTQQQRNPPLQQEH